MAFAGFRSDSVFPYYGTVILTVFRFAESVIKASKGEKGIVEPTFIYLPGVPGGAAIAEATGVDFFSVPVELGVRTSPYDCS